MLSEAVVWAELRERRPLAPHSPQRVTDEVKHFVRKLSNGEVYFDEVLSWNDDILRLLKRARVTETVLSQDCSTKWCLNKGVIDNLLDNDHRR